MTSKHSPLFYVFGGTVLLVALPAALTSCVSREFNKELAKTRDSRVFSATATATRNAECDVIVAGGSTAALAAALTAAREGRQTCLLEPTNWPGGQLSASAVSAIDFPHYSVNGVDMGPEHRKHANIAGTFLSWINTLNDGSVSCWVTAVGCFEPINMLNKNIFPALAKEPNLRVFYSTIIKSVATEGRNIQSLTAISREPLVGNGYEDFLSKSLPDWYSFTDSPSFRKIQLNVKGKGGNVPVFIDATEFGDVMVLAGASFLQGVEKSDGSLETEPGYDKAGQATVFPFVMSYNKAASSEALNPLPVDHPSFYKLNTSSWDQVWRYRRIRGAGPLATPGDLSLQNWNPGNDYPYGYVFKSKADTLAERSNWQGGIDLTTLAGAERHAYGFYYFMKNHKDAKNPNLFTLDKTALGTKSGLSKMPYLRDTRRSIGLGDFVLRYTDISGPQSKWVANIFDDRVGIGAYVVDIHSVYTLPMPAYLNSIPTLPYMIPFRALTNRDFNNLLVAGKTMAQSYLANAATRLQPIEWHSGLASGAAAAHMAQWQLSSQGALDNIKDIQIRVKRHAPIAWTIAGKRYPTSD